MRDQFEHYRASVSTAIEERPPGELSRALDAILPDLVFREGQAFAAGVGLSRLDAGGGRAEVADDLALSLVDQQAARRSAYYLACIASVLSRTRQMIVSP